MATMPVANFERQAEAADLLGLDTSAMALGSLRITWKAPVDEEGNLVEPTLENPIRVNAQWEDLEGTHHVRALTVDQADAVTKALREGSL